MLITKKLIQFSLVPFRKSSDKLLGFGLSVKNTFNYYFLREQNQNKSKQIIVVNNNTIIATRMQENKVEQNNHDSKFILLLNESLLMVESAATSITNLNGGESGGPDLPNDIDVKSILNVNKSTVFLIGNNYQILMFNLSNQTIKSIELKHFGEIPSNIMTCGYEIQKKFILCLSNDKNKTSILSYPFTQWNHEGPKHHADISEAKITSDTNNKGLFLIGVTKITSELYFAKLKCDEECVWIELGKSKPIENEPIDNISNAIKIPPDYFNECSENAKPGFYGIDNLGNYIEFVKQ